MSDSLLGYKLTGWFTQFKPDLWAELSPDERLCLLQEAEYHAAAEENREPREIVTRSMADKAYGAYLPSDPKKIYINEKLIQTQYLDDYYNTGDISPGYTASIALSTVLHEGRHAFQDDCIKGKHAYINGVESNTRLAEHAKIDDETLKLWKKQDLAYFHHTKDDPYLTPLDKHLQYYFQPVEDDAEAFAMRKLQEWADKIGDSQFRTCCTTQMILREYKENDARELWQTPNFREEIAKDVLKKYDLIMKKRASAQPSAAEKKSAQPLPKGKHAIIQYALFAATLLYLLIVYLISAPSGLLHHLLWIMSAVIPFLPVILMLRFFPKLRSRKGGILLAAIFGVFLLLIQLFYSWLMLLFLVGGTWVLIKGLGSVAPNMLTITRENADGTTTTETRILGDNPSSEINAVKSELRREGYTDIREG